MKPYQTKLTQIKPNFIVSKKNLLVKIFGQKKHFWLRQKKFRKKIQVQKILLKKNFAQKNYGQRNLAKKFG